MDSISDTWMNSTHVSAHYNEFAGTDGHAATQHRMARRLTSGAQTPITFSQIDSVTRGVMVNRVMDTLVGATHALGKALQSPKNTCEVAIRRNFAAKIIDEHDAMREAHATVVMGAVVGVLGLTVSAQRYELGMVIFAGSGVLALWALTQAEGHRSRIDTLHEEEREALDRLARRWGLGGYTLSTGVIG